jgi:hypothetical protein
VEEMNTIFASRTRDAVLFAPAKQESVTTTAGPTLSWNTQGYDAAWDQVISKLISFRGLNDDWDGEGSPAPKTELVDWIVSHALNFWRYEYAVPSRIIVTVDGTIALEWREPQGISGVEISSDCIEMYGKPSTIVRRFCEDMNS